MESTSTFSSDLVTNTAHARYGKPWRSCRRRLRARGINVDSCFVISIDTGEFKHQVVCEMVLPDGQAVAFTLHHGFWCTSVVEWHEIPADDATADPCVAEARKIMADGRLAEFDLAVAARARELGYKHKGLLI